MLENEDGIEDEWEKSRAIQCRTVRQRCPVNL